MAVVDDLTRKTWLSILKNLNFKGLELAIRELSKNYTKPPSLTEIIAMYTNLKTEKENKGLDKKNNDFKQIVDKQSYCFLCKNTGWADYEKKENGYMYIIHARCTCSHGQDLRRFTSSQMTSSNNHYLRTVKEVLGQENYDLLLAKRKAENYKAVKEQEDMKVVDLQQLMFTTNKEMKVWFIA